MNERKATKRALLTSITALAMCVVMLVGTTFAWFTDTAKTNVNTIKAGKLDVQLMMKNSSGRWVNAEGETLNWLKAQDGENQAILWEPGAEYKLLCFFMRHPNAVLSKEQILDALWDCDGDYIDSSALTVYIRRLRMKIEDDPSKPQMLLTVRGMGYKWNG